MSLKLVETIIKIFVISLGTLIIFAFEFSKYIFLRFIFQLLVDNKCHVDFMYFVVLKGFLTWCNDFSIHCILISKRVVTVCLLNIHTVFSNVFFNIFCILREWGILNLLLIIDRFLFTNAICFEWVMSFDGKLYLPFKG